MPTPVISGSAAHFVRLLLQALQRGDREAIMLHLVELGLCVSMDSDPLPSPDVGVVSATALTVTLNELRSTIQNQRELSASILDRDTSAVAAIIERNTEIMEGVVRTLSVLTPTSGFVMVEG